VLLRKIRTGVNVMEAITSDCSVVCHFFFSQLARGVLATGHYITHVSLRISLIFARTIVLVRLYCQCELPIYASIEYQRF
jgi:hypothetical protein